MRGKSVVVNLICVIFSVQQSFAQIDRSAVIDQCIDAEIEEHAARIPFSQSGSVECPSADIRGFPPQERRHNRSATIIYTPPEGFLIETRDPDKLPKVTQGHTVGGGSTGPIEYSEDRASVLISCRGDGLTKGGTWRNVVITGELYRPPSVDLLKNWTLECALKDR